MKKLTLAITFMLIGAGFLQAKSNDYIDKIINLYNVTASGSIDYNATRVDSGYDLSIKTQDNFFKAFLNGKKIHINVDDGPLVTSPHFTFATAGLSAKGSVLKLLKPEVVKDLNNSLKGNPSYNYEGKVTFGGELEESLTLDPINIDTKDMTLKTSKVTSNSSFDLDTITGEQTIKIDNITLKPKQQKVGDMSADGIKINLKVNQEPIENIMLFSNFRVDIKKLHFSTKGKKEETNLSTSIGGYTKRVDAKFLDANINYNFKALDEATIARAKGIKSLDLKLDIKNIGIDGALELAKMQREYAELNREMIETSKRNDTVAMQKAILKNQEMVNKFVPIWNKIIVANKTKIILDLEADGQKKSFIKLDLIYKGKPLSGNANSAFISLAAQQLNLFDGDVEIKLDSNLASSINPLAVMGLAMLKGKNLIKQENGVYHLKAKLKSGKIVINGKAYTVAELGKALF